MDFTLTLITAIGGGAIVSLIQFLINRHDNKHSKLNGITDTLNHMDKKLSLLKKDSERTQLLLLITSYPKRTDEILEVAHQYFVCDGGNWYMTKLFTDWCNENGGDYEPLFKEKEGKK